MYSKQTWENDKGLDLQASHLNHMEDGIAAAHTIAESKQGKLTAGENIHIDENNVISASGGGGGGIPDAPADGYTYGRKNYSWTKIEQGGGEPDQYLKTIAKNETNKEITITDKQGNATTFAYGGGGGGGITLLDVYPVGSIYMSVNSVSPATLFGGTWEEWGSGQVPVGVKSGDTDFGTAEKTGGSKDAIVVEHEHGMGSHTHSIGSHTHSIGSHTHSIGSHTHSFSGTTDSDGSHQHSFGADKQCAKGTGQYEPHSSGTGGTTLYTNSTGSHTHSFDGTTGSASGNTGSASGTTGSSSGNTGSASGETSSAGTSGTGKNLQPYITCYMWKRTA